MFEWVNQVYAPADVRFTPTVTYTSPTVPCAAGSGDENKFICGPYKCRTGDYITKWFGHRTRDMDDAEIVVLIPSLIPREFLKEKAFNLVYTKFLGNTLQGFVQSSESWLRPSMESIQIANVAQWSNKFSESPVKRPTVLDCKSQTEYPSCKLSIAFTTAHELGHLLTLKHTDNPGIMYGGGAIGQEAAFSAAHIESIRTFLERKRFNGYQPTLFSTSWYRAILQATRPLKQREIGMYPYKLNTQCPQAPPGPSTEASTEERFADAYPKNCRMFAREQCGELDGWMTQFCKGTCSEEDNTAGAEQGNTAGAEQGNACRERCGQLFDMVKQICENACAMFDAGKGFGFNGEEQGQIVPDDSKDIVVPQEAMENAAASSAPHSLVMAAVFALLCVQYIVA